MKKTSRIAVIVSVSVLLITIPVLAQSYTASITVSETEGEDYIQLPIIVDVNNQFLADSGYIIPSGLDTRVLEASSVLPHMLAVNKTLFVSDIDANTQSNFRYTLGNSALSAFYVIVGYEGYFTVIDDEDLELGDNFAIEIKGYVQTTFGSYTDRNLIYKADAFKLCVSDAGEVTATITGTPDKSVTANNVDSKVHTIRITGDGTYFKIFIDGSEKDSTDVISVPDENSNWEFLKNGVMSYMEHLKVEIG